MFLLTKLQITGAPRITARNTNLFFQDIPVYIDDVIPHLLLGSNRGQIESIVWRERWITVFHQSFIDFLPEVVKGLHTGISGST